MNKKEEVGGKILSCCSCKKKLPENIILFYNFSFIIINKKNYKMVYMTEGSTPLINIIHTLVTCISYFYQI